MPGCIALPTHNNRQPEYAAPAATLDNPTMVPLNQVFILITTKIPPARMTLQRRMRMRTRMRTDLQSLIMMGMVPWTDRTFLLSSMLSLLRYTMQYLTGSVMLQSSTTSNSVMSRPPYQALPQLPSTPGTAGKRSSIAVEVTFHTFAVNKSLQDLVSLNACASKTPIALMFITFLRESVEASE